MEHVLRHNMLTVATAFARRNALRITSVSQLAARDYGFLTRISRGDRTFTAKKYDEVMGWFSDHWSDDCPWPAGVERPRKAEAA